MNLKHVIFLGAGASKTSGYPLADELRLRLSSWKIFEEHLKKVTQHPGGASGGSVVATMRQHFQKFNDTIRLFRFGGFGTIDEFSKLATTNDVEHVQKMKHLMMAALLLYNPEEFFYESDYYPFIQKLFANDLHSLRNNLSVLSYNYDCYLEFLLIRADEIRRQIGGRPKAQSADMNRLTSGFHNPLNSDDLTSSPGRFVYLKLHGSIANTQGETHKEYLETTFSENVHQRFAKFDRIGYENVIPPVVYPWELFEESGSFIAQENFIFVKQAKIDINRHALASANSLYMHYKSIWEAARQTVQEAQKISFVGMRMHPYLKFGLKFLFEGKKDEIESVLANNANDSEEFRDKESLTIFQAGSPRERAIAMLKSIAPEMQLKQSSAEFTFGVPSFDLKNSGFNSAITPRYSFRDFIEKEID